MQKRIVAVAKLLSIGFIVLSSMFNTACKEEESNPYVDSIHIDIYVSDSPIKGYSTFQSKDFFEVEFQYPEGAETEVYMWPEAKYLIRSIGPDRYDSKYTLSMSVTLTSNTDGEYVSIEGSLSCNECDWILPNEKITGIPIDYFSCNCTGGNNESIDVKIGASNGEDAFILLQASPTLPESEPISIESQKEIINKIIDTLYIDFDTWRSSYLNPATAERRSIRR